jgi:hypothetical protein
MNQIAHCSANLAIETIVDGFSSQIGLVMYHCLQGRPISARLTLFKKSSTLERLQPRIDTAAEVLEKPKEINRMNKWEKTGSILAIAFAFCLIALLLSFPELRELNRLLPICALGMAVNVGLMFLVLRDIFLRQFSNPNTRFVWLVLILFVWPSAMYYLFRYGFRPRS